MEDKLNAESNSSEDEWNPEDCRPKTYGPGEGFYYQGAFRHFQEYSPDVWAQYLKEGKVIYPYIKLARKWDVELSATMQAEQKPFFLRALLKSFGLKYCLVGLLAFVEECLMRLGQPLCLGGLILYFNKPSGTSDCYVGILYASGIVIGAIFYTSTHHPFFWGVQHSGMQMRIASCSLIYRKALKLSNSALGHTTVGQMVNLLSNDVSRFDSGVIFLHYIWIGPIQTILVSFLLWEQLNSASCFAGILLLVLFVPLQSWMSRIFSRLRLETANEADERIRVINEIINAVRVIKMYAWEKPFSALVKEIRRKEINIIMNTNYYRALNMSLFFTSTKVVVFLALIVFVFTGNVLTAEKVFVTFSLINNLRLTMTLSFPRGVAAASDMYVSCMRIEEFLLMEEREHNSRIMKTSLNSNMQKGFIEATDISAHWKTSEEHFNIKAISFKTMVGELTAIVGSVGSGKSSLLHALLGEMPIKNGSLEICGKVAYSSQEPWLFDGTVRQNILFGASFKPQKYYEIIKVCALEKDLEALPDGDHTMVGERGVSLSGGQKARINLARAVYFDAEIYLLDDPLSAVDMHVGTHLYEECIQKYLRNKACILVTHQLQYIKEANQILVIREGKIEAQGTYEELTKQGVDFTKLANKKDLNFKHCDSTAAEITKEDSNIYPPKLTDTEIAQNNINRKLSFEVTQNTASSNPAVSGRKHGKNSLNLKNLEAESNSTNSVGPQIYSKYFMAGGGMLYSTCFIILCVLTQALYTGSDYWMAYWTNQEQMITEVVFNGTSIPWSNNTNNTETAIFPSKQDWTREEYVYIYTGMIGSLFFISMLRTVLFFAICMKASMTLHNEMFEAIIRAPIAFFDTHPIGGILNRFSKDIGQIDDLLPPTFYDFIEIFLNCVGVIVIVSTVNVWSFLPTVVLFTIFLFVRKLFLSSARDVKRLEGVTRSPVFSHLSASLDGLTTIRALQAEETLICEFDAHQDLHSSSWFLYLTTSRCFGLWLDILATIFIAVVTFSFLGQEGVRGCDVGLAISYTMMFCSMFQWGVYQSAEVEHQMTSVERVIDYSNIEPETKKSEHKKLMENSWPNRGKLSFQNVNLYYDEYSRHVLKNVSFTVEAGEKIGIVGRTGAGKTSLFTCLFRMTQPEGTILIDDVDTSTVELNDLRRSISIIPQSPTLFKRSFRYNLDPFSNYTDEQIWNALEDVQLKNLVKGMAEGLSSSISEGGMNLSAGQRQLACLARAILKRNKIFAMDEATANVDLQTNANIQEIIRTKLGDCTVLTIAHRLNTIMDYDKVLVMDAGNVMEYDAPFKLLLDNNTLFSRLVRQTGPEEEKILRKIAEDAYLRRISLSNSMFTDTIQSP